MATARQTLDHAVTEKAFMATVVEMAQRLGWLTYHTHDSRRSAAGFPDLVMVRGERLVFAELKAGKGKAADTQITWLTALVDAGQAVYLWWPSDMDTIEAVLR